MQQIGLFQEKVSLGVEGNFLNQIAWGSFLFFGVAFN